MKDGGSFSTMEILFLKLCDFLVFIFIKNWIKSVHQEGKRFSHNFIAHKFHLSYVQVFAKLCDEQIIILTFPWKFPHYYEVYEESDAKCSCGVQEVKLSLLTSE